MFILLNAIKTTVTKTEDFISYFYLKQQVYSGYIPPLTKIYIT